MVKMLAVCMFLLSWSQCNTQLINSGSAMEVLLETQERIINHIEGYERYITDSKQAVIVKKFLSRCRKEHQLSMWDPSHYLANPINAYCLIMRLSRDLSYIEKILNETTTGVMKYQPVNTLIYPTEEDVVGVVEGMARLQLLYDLDVKDMANGTFTTSFVKISASIEYVSPMTCCDCYELGLVEYEKDDRSRNIAWLKEALRKHEYGGECPINKVHIFDRLSGDYFFMGEIEKSIYWLEKRIEARPADTINAEYRKAILRMKGLGVKSRAKPDKKIKLRDFNAFPNVCLKSYFSSNASLTCYYSHGPHPFLRIAPMKAEKLHLKPEILMFYDAITDDEILDLKNLAKPRFQQARASTVNGTTKFDYCMHLVSWLRDDWSNATRRLAQRISQFTGLVISVNNSEEFQVANYGTGGNYGPHYDFIQPNASSSVAAKRLATALFYMSDVDIGGATVFTKIGLNVPPVKNAVVFWWNLDPAGDGDFSTEHATCPVLLGSRWVVTKWISLSGQELVRPCPVEYPKLYGRRKHSYCSVCSK